MSYDEWETIECPRCGQRCLVASGMFDASKGYLPSWGGIFGAIPGGHTTLDHRGYCLPGRRYREPWWLRIIRWLSLSLATISTGCAGAAFTGLEDGPASSTAIIDSASGDATDAAPDASEQPDALAVDVHADAAIETVDGGGSDVATDAATEVDAAPLTVCDPPANNGYRYMVHGPTGCVLEPTPAVCLAASNYNCACFTAHASEIATSCASGWTACDVNASSGVMLEVTCR